MPPVINITSPEASGPLAHWLGTAPGQAVVYAEMGISWMEKEDSDLAIERTRAAWV